MRGADLPFDNSPEFKAKMNTEYVVEQMLRHFEGTLVCFRDIELSFTAACLNDHICLIFYERGGSICWDLETGEVSTLRSRP